MIISYIGTPGSGKSYDAVRRILRLLKDGRKVYTNIDGFEDSSCQEGVRVLSGLDPKTLKQRLVFLPKEKMVHFWDFVDQGSVVVIDEVHKLFGNREWSTEKNVKFSEFCSTHRHFGYDLILLTQHIDKVDVQVRTMVEWTFKYRKINFFGKAFQGRFMRQTYAGNDVDGECIKKDFGKYESKYFPCYKSFATQGIKELNLQTSVNVFKRPIFVMILICLIGFGYTLSKSSLWDGGFLKAPKIRKGIEKIIPSGDVEAKVDEVKARDPQMSEVPKEVRQEISKIVSEVNGKGSVDDPGVTEGVQVWGATYKPGKEGKTEVYESGRYVGWFKVVKE